MASHFTDPGRLIDDVLTRAVEVLSPLRELDGAIHQAAAQAHAGRLSNDATDPLGFESGDSGTIYLHPYKGTASLNRTDDGFVVSEIPQTPISLDISGLINGVYDVFEYDNNGMPALETFSWLSYIARNWALVPDGIMGYTKFNDSTRKYRGTIWVINGVVSQTVLRSSIWNQFNRIRRIMKKRPTSNWAFIATSTWRQASNVGYFSVVSPWDDMPGDASYYVNMTNTGGTTKIALVTGGPGVSNEYVSTSRGDGIGTEMTLCTAANVALDAGLRYVSPYEFVTAGATFYGNEYAELALDWFC